MLLIHADEKEDISPGDPGFEEMMTGYRSLAEELRAKGQMVHGDPLQPSTTATSLRYNGDRLMMSDGPYAETREQLGGYYLVDCGSREEAVGYAARIPAAKRGGIEVRELFGVESRVFLEGEGEHYVLLIYTADPAVMPPPKGTQPGGPSRHQPLKQRMEAANAFVLGDALCPAETATTVRVRDGQTLITDGPFAETREQLGGFYGLRCKDLDEALDYARELAEISARTSGCIEVRPVANYG
jgi:hypothetical protein